MNINPFTSIFEIYIAIYVVYIVSKQVSNKSFVGSLISNILQPFNITIENSSKSLNEIALNIATCSNIAKKITDYNITLTATFTQQLEDTTTELKLYEQKFEELKKAFDDFLYKIYINKSFRYISFYMVLFSFQILIVGQFWDIIFPLTSINFYLSLTIVSLIYLFFAYLYESKKLHNTKDFWNKHNGYNIVIYSHLGIIIISIILAFISKDTNIILSKLIHNLLLITLVLIPFSNFVIYLYIAKRRINFTKNNQTFKDLCSANEDWESAKLALQDNLKEINAIIRNNSETSSPIVENTQA